MGDNVIRKREERDIHTYIRRSVGMNENVEGKVKKKPCLYLSCRSGMGAVIGL